MSTQIIVHLTDQQAAVLDAAASALRRSRAEIVRVAVEQYLEHFDDVTVAVERLLDSSDPALDWNKARSVLLGMETERID